MVCSACVSNPRSSRRGYNLVTEVKESPLEASLALAKEIAARSPDCVSATKALYNATYATGSEERALRIESELQIKLLGGKNQLLSSFRGLGLPLPAGYFARSSTWNNDLPPEMQFDDEAEAEAERVERAEAEAERVERAEAERPQPSDDGSGTKKK